MARFITHHHQQQDRMCSNQCLCTLCVFNLCLLFGDNQTRLGGGGPKSGGSGDTRRQKAVENTEEKEGCQADCEKRVTLGNYLPVIRPPARNTKGRPESRTNSKISSFVLCLTLKSHL